MPLIPVNPSKALKHSGGRSRDPVDDADIDVEVIPYQTTEAKTVGRAKTTGRTVIMNRKGP